MYGIRLKGEKLRVDQAVIVVPRDHRLNKKESVGHTCRIKRACIYYKEGEALWRYVLSWRKEDNPGKVYPECIDRYYYQEDDLLIVGAPQLSIFLNAEDLPNF